MSKSSGSLTEVDLIKQVALHHAKQHRGNSQDLREQTKDNFRIIFRVFMAFTKLLRSQLCSKGKGVDTLYFGFLYKDETSQKITYLPSKDYLEAGKFKWTGDPIEKLD